MTTKVLTGNISLHVMREKQVVLVPRGEAFDFTDKELDDLDRIAADKGDEPYYRDPVNEAPVEAKVEKKGKGGDSDI